VRARGIGSGHPTRSVRFGVSEPSPATPGTSSKASAVLVALTLLTSFGLVLPRYAGICMLPGCIGWLLMLISLPATWKERRRGFLLAIAGTGLLLMHLSGFAFSIIADIAGHYRHVSHLDRYDALVSLALLLDVAALGVLARRIQSAKPPKGHECRNCGYDLHGLSPSTKCPECGSRRQ
jgi:hypothetical protein